jgi:hypothetical protein
MNKALRISLPVLLSVLAFGASASVALAATPVATSTTATTTEDTPVLVSLTASDADGNQLAFATTTSPVNGMLGTIGVATCTATSTVATSTTCTALVLYSPNLNFNGTDSFDFVAIDTVTGATSTPATATILVTAVNDPPMATPTSTTTPEDTPVTVTLAATDVDSPALTFATTTSPANGMLGALGAPLCTPVASGTSCIATTTYTPNLNFNGTDSFLFVANDGLATSTATTSTIIVTAVNDTPVALPVSATTTTNTAVHVALMATDVDGDQLTFATSTSPANGILGPIGTAICTATSTLVASTTCTALVMYTPNLGFTGTDMFNFTASDATSTSNMATATIAVVNDIAPVAEPASATTTTNTPVDVTLTASDADGNQLMFATTTSPANGTLGPISAAICSATSTLATSTTCTAIVTYSPNLGFTGLDTFNFVANDGIVNSNVATATIAVVAPVAAVTPSLGAASTFGILASTFTNTSSTTIIGDVGFTTGPAVPATVTGTVHVADAVYNQAGIDQGRALSSLASSTCTFTFPIGAIDLSTDTTHGPIGIFSPGVYCVRGAASIGTAGITLSGLGTYIFRITGALNSVANSSVRLATTTGPSANDVFWTPVGATTLGANSSFVGTDIDNAGITLGSTTTWLGRSLAFGGTVTTDTDVITVPRVADVIPPVITLNGAASITLPFGNTFIDPGATATDNVDGTDPVVVGGDTVNIGLAGTYTVTYNATDAAGNHAVQVIRTVTISPNVTGAGLSGGGGGGGGGGGFSPVPGGSNQQGSPVPGLPLTGTAPSLSETQIQSFISLLTSFGVDQSTIDRAVAALRGQGQGSSGNSGKHSFGHDLENGKTDGDVLSLQQFLNGHGFMVSNSGPGSSGQESMVFGPKTRAALIRFQMARGITPAVGFFGPKTRAQVNLED